MEEIDQNPIIQSEDIDIEKVGIDSFRKMKFKFPEESDETICRFLLARNKDVVKASEMLINHISWRASNLPPQKASCMKEFSAGKCYVNGCDKEGHPLIIVISRLHDPSDRDIDELLRLCIWWIEYGVSKMPPNKSKFSVLINRSGATQANTDLEFIKHMSKMLSDNYPERMATCVIHPTSVLFFSLWSIAKLFLDPVTQAKVQPIIYQSALPNFIDKQYIPLELVIIFLTVTYDI
jgi:hypothetical protein